ncbi:hypothetical protein [Lactococcus petauri]|uniref:hypothetical protein n=1 Tax=Lactococcus petauri TaxID=1940789 RepID=UPI001FCC1865|nr:hypothetical protein [Lactococcus petauri]
MQKLLPTQASILPYDIGTITSVNSNFTIDGREYNGTNDIIHNGWVADIFLDDGTELEIPYLAKNLHFKQVHAGTNELDLNEILFDEVYEYYFKNIGKVQEYIMNDILAYREAYITPRRIQWTEGQVFDKEWDGTPEVHRVRTMPDLARAGSRLEEVIGARDRAAIRVEEGWAQS